MFFPSSYAFGCRLRHSLRYESTDCGALINVTTEVLMHASNVRPTGRLRRDFRYPCNILVISLRSRVYTFRDTLTPAC